MSLHHDRLRAQHGHPLHQDHTETLETGIATAVHEIDELRTERDQLRATVERVQELAVDLENSPQVGYDSSEQWELDTRRIVARELRAALGGDS